MSRTDDQLANYAALSATCAARVLTLKKIAGINVTPVLLTPGHYQVRVPNGTSADTVTFLWKTSATNVADTALTMPAAGAAEVTGLASMPGDAWPTLYIDPAAPYLACAWDGGADSTLHLTRVYP